MSLKGGKRPLRECCTNQKRSCKRFSVSALEQVAEFNRTLEPTYAEDINASHRENEDRQWQEKPCWDGFAPQTEVNQNMRAILVDWLIEVVEEYTLREETLYLAVNYVDRVLESVVVTRSTLQLVGITCLFIACKYEEVHPPLIEDFVYITDNTYVREQILQTEYIVLNALKFRLTITTMKNFLTRFLLISDINDMQVVNHAKYLSEMILSVYSIHRKYRPSHIAAAVVTISKTTFSLQSWTLAFEIYTSYKRTDLRQCIREIYYLHEHVSAAPTGKLTSAREKYRQQKYFCVSTIPLSPNVLAL